MSIYLGNLSTKEMEARLGILFPQKLVEYMAANHQESASNIKPGKWHCFDLPFVLVCGDIETAKEIHKHLVPMQSDMKTVLQISIT